MSKHEDRARLRAGIWALGLVSLFMDISSEMIHALLPMFLVTVLGASTLTVGAIESIGEATAAVSKLFSGWLSDRLGHRKMLTIVGYGLGALSKPLFALAPAASWVLLARFTDRPGKGTWGAPRDALVGDLAPPGMQAGRGLWAAPIAGWIRSVSSSGRFSRSHSWRRSTIVFAGCSGAR